MDRQPYTVEIKEVLAALGMTSRAALYAIINAKKFPPGIPTSDGGKTVVWLWKDVEAYLHLISRIHQAKPQKDDADDKE